MDGRGSAGQAHDVKKFFPHIHTETAKEALLEQPLVSIVIPVYNAAPDLARCIESVRKQTYRNLEIFLVNDGSKDASGSQKDRVVQAKKEALHNKAIKSNLKTVVKKADAAISAGAADKDAAVKAAVVAIDKAAAKGVLHKNTASRKVSRLAKAADKAGK